MKKIILFILVLVVLPFDLCHANRLFLLYGFKIGQPIKNVQAQYGKPTKVIKFKDGFVSYAYGFKKHYVVFTCDNSRPDLVWGIQLSGLINPKDHGLNGLNLGDSKEKVIKIFGKPEDSRTAMDEISKKKMNDIFIYAYYGKGNYSIELTKNKVTSIKLLYNRPIETKKLIDFNDFMQTVKSKNYYKLASYVSADFYIVKDKKEYTLTKSIFHNLINDKIISDAFFNKSYGLISLGGNDKIERTMRFHNNEAGYVIKIRKKNMKYDMFFARSYEGWVLRYIIFI